MSKSARLSRDSLISNPRATFSAWKRYENIVEAARQLHPRPYIFKPANLSNTTVVSRIRDAIRGAIVFGYTNDTHGLASWFDEIVVKEYSDGQVFIGRLDMPVTPPILGEEQNKELRFNSLTFEEVTAFCLLLNNNRIEGPLHITQPPRELTLLPDYTNICITHNPDGSATII